MPSQWDHKADKDLLLTIIEAGNLTHIDWHTVAAALKAKDYTFSHEACRQHYQKMRKEGKKPQTSNGNDSASTPAKATSAKATSTKATPGSRKRNAKAVNHEGDDEEELNGSPSIKRKKMVKTELKLEPFGVDGYLEQADGYCDTLRPKDEEGWSREVVIDVDHENLNEA